MRGILGRATVFAGALLGLGLLGSAAAEEPIKLKVSHFLPPMGNSQTKLLQPWADRIEKDSNGRIKVEIYPSMQLGGKPPQLFDQVRTGVADVVWTLPSYTPGRFPLVEVFELPFMTANTAEATTQAVWDFYQKYLKEEFKDVHVLLLHTHAPGLIHMKDKAVTTQDELLGKKIRLPTKSIGDALKALGAVPVGMPVPDVYEALSRGVVDGTLIPWEVVTATRVNELARHHTVARLYTSVFLMGMNKEKYDSLPADLKAVIDKNSGSNIIQEIGKAWDDAEQPAFKQATELGHEIVDLPPAERERWIKATRPVVDAWIARTPNGQALYDEAAALIKKYDTK